MTRTRRIALALAFALPAAFAALAPRQAQAGPTWSITSDAQGGVSHLATVTWTFQGKSETGLAGTLTTTAPGVPAFSTYCVDLHDTTIVGNGGSTWTAQLQPISSFVGNTAHALTGGNGGAIGYLYSEFAAGATSRIQGAALQIAIWKVEYDDSASLSTGNFRFADSCDPCSDQHLVHAQAASYLCGFNGTQSSGNALLFQATSHPNGLYQDLVGPGSVAPYIITASAVPEPASLAMVGIGLAVAATIAARRNRRAA